MNCFSIFLKATHNNLKNDLLCGEPNQPLTDLISPYWYGKVDADGGIHTEALTTNC